MVKKNLDGGRVRPFLKQPCGEAVTEDVGGDVSDSRRLGRSLEGEGHGLCVDGISACPCRKDSVGIPVQAPRPA